MSSNEAPNFNNAFGSDDILLNSSLSHTNFLLLNSSDLTKPLTPSQPSSYSSPLNSLDTFELPTQQPTVVEPVKQFNTFNHPDIQPEQTRTLSTTTRDPITGMVIDALYVNQAVSDSLLNSNTTTPLITNNNIWAIKAEGTVTVNGSGDFDGAPLITSDDALIYAGLGFTLKGNPELPVQRDATGNPIKDNSGKSLLVNNAVVVAPGYTVSSATTNHYANLLPPQIVNPLTVTVPNYSDIQQLTLANAIPTGTTTVTFNATKTIKNASDWTKLFPPAGTTNNPKIVRVTGGTLNIPTGVNLNNYVIIVEQGDIQVNGSNQTLNNVVLVTNNGSINLNNAQSTNLKVLASNSISTSGSSRFSGETLLANGSVNGSITFNGATKTTLNSDRTTLISQGSITYNGATNTNATLLSVKDITYNGNSTLYGAIATKSNITFNGNSQVVAGFFDTAPPSITAGLFKDTAAGNTTNTDLITSDPTITGTVTDASLITSFTAYFNNVNNPVNIRPQLNSDGSFTLNRTILEQIYGATLPDGVQTLHLQAVDLYGNVSVKDFNFTLDTTAPAATNLNLTASSDSGISNNDKVTNISTPTIAEVAEVGSLVQLYSSGQLIGSTTANPSGNWQITTNTLPDGVQNLTAIVSDVAGNTSAVSTALTINIDTHAPSGATNLQLTNNSDSGISNNDKVTNITTPTITGIAEAGTRVQLYSDGQLVGSTTANTDKTWLITTTSLTEGNHTITAIVTDIAGNVSTLSDPLNIVIDTTAPLTPSGLKLTANTDTGVSNSDNITNNSTPTITGIGEAGSIIKLFKDNSLVGTTTVSSDGTWLIPIAQQLTDGLYQFKAVAEDTAGNVSTPSELITITIDTNSTAPAGLDLLDKSDSGSSNNDNITNKNSVEIAGLAEIGSTVQLFKGEQLVGNAITKSDGTWVINTLTLTDGIQNIKAVTTDIAGNVSIPSTPLSVEIDTIAPTVPNFILDPNFDTAPIGDSRTRKNSVTLIGQSDADLSLQLQPTGSITTTNTNGQFEFTNIPLVLGENALTVQVVDTAGNQSTFTKNITRLTNDGTDSVIDWNANLLNAVRIDRTAPPLASRNMAMVHTAIYDAVNAISKTYQVYHVDTVAPADASAEAAVAAAAHRVLVELYPKQKVTFDAELAFSLAEIPDGTAEDSGVALGEFVAEQILDWRSNDGSNTVVAYNPGTQPGEWQPTPTDYAGAVLPQWPSVTPFALTSGSQFRPDGTFALNSAEYTADFNQVKELGRFDSTTRTAEQTEIAKFWADGGGTYTPPGHWNQIAEQTAVSQGNTLLENARLFALLNIGLADAGIAAWDAKYTYNSWRPITAIRQADTDGNPNTISDPTWKPLIVTPPFPEYISGHSTFSGAADAVLTSFFGNNLSFTTNSIGLSGVNRSFNNFTAAASEAGISRIYGGIHFLKANEDGLKTGRDVGSYVVENFLKSNVQSDVLVAALANDTAPMGQTNRDSVTFDPTIKGSIRNGTANKSLKAGFDTTPLTNYLDVTTAVSTDGSFLLNRSQLEAIYGSALPDGVHTLHLQELDAIGNLAGSADVTFTLDTVQPSLSLETPIANANHSKTARLIGSVTDTGGVAKNAQYSLDGQLPQSMSVDATGRFNQALSTTNLTVGNHQTTLSAFDVAGNAAQTSVNFAVTDNFILGNPATVGDAGWGIQTNNGLVLGEQGSFVTQTAIKIELGQAQGTRSLQFDVDAKFDLSDTSKVSADRLLIYLVNPANPSQTLLDRGEPGTALFSLSGNTAEFTPGLVRFNGKTVEIDLSSLADQTNGLLVFQLLNTDADSGSVVRVQSLSNVVDSEGVPSPVFPTVVNRANVGNALSLDRFNSTQDVAVMLSNVHLDSTSGRYIADLQVQNTGTTTISRKLAVLFTNLPDSVELVNASGVHPAGSPYINISNAISSDLAPGAKSLPVQIIFNDPQLLRFGIQPVILAGALESGSRVSFIG